MPLEFSRGIFIFSFFNHKVHRAKAQRKTKFGFSICTATCALAFSLFSTTKYTEQKHREKLSLAFQFAHQLEL